MRAKPTPVPVRGNARIPASTLNAKREQMKPDKPRTQTWVKHHKRRNYAIVGIVTAVLVIIIIGPSSMTPYGAQVGQRAPDFTTTDINNTTFHLAAMKGKPILLEFMRTTCHYCVDEASILSQLYSTHGTHVEFVSVSIDPTTDTTSVLSTFAADYNSPWTWIRDTGNPPVWQTYGVSGTPTTFLLDSSGVIKNRFGGAETLQNLDAACSALT